MADPHALTMSRNGTRSGRESVCLPPPNPSLGCPRLPPSGVADSHAGRTRTTKPGEITIRGPVRTHPSWSARCDRHRSTTGDGLYAVQGIAKGRSSCRSLARSRSTRHESAWCEPLSCIVIDLCSSKASRVPESRNPRPVEEQLSSITLSRLHLLARGLAKVLAVKTKPRRVLRSARQRGRPGARWGVDRGRSGHRFPRSR
jgi:hypothetical protein